jgi:hypothetical protein
MLLRAIGLEKQKILSFVERYKMFRRQKQLYCLDISIKAQQPKNQQYKA